MSKKVFVNENLDLVLEGSEQYNSSKELDEVNLIDLLDWACLGHVFEEAVQTTEGTYKWVVDSRNEIAEYILQVAA